jgi:hypothetical protein
MSLISIQNLSVKHINEVDMKYEYLLRIRFCSTISLIILSMLTLGKLEKMTEGLNYYKQRSVHLFESI